MTATVTLLSERNEFASLWRPALERYGLSVRISVPSTVSGLAGAGALLVVDGGSEALDEDELLAAVGFARAMGARPVAHLSEARPMVAIDDVLDELCCGLVARSERDVERIAAALARRSVRERSSRFEFVTVSPRRGEMLAIMGDGRTVLLHRPLSDADDGSEVVSIDLADDATGATARLESGASVELSAARVLPNMGNGSAERTNGAATVDGSRLGARLRELRLAAGLTQAELARRTGIHRPNIARVEAGRHTPSLETLTRLATAIGVSATRVLSEE
jgi:DNA-binding XRE family transcriptional regulator